MKSVKYNIWCCERNYNFEQEQFLCDFTLISDATDINFIAEVEHCNT